MPVMAQMIVYSGLRFCNRVIDFQCPACVWSSKDELMEEEETSKVDGRVRGEVKEF